MSSGNTTIITVEGSAERIFGQGTSISGWHVFIGFAVVAAYMTVGSEGLNFIENHTTGTSYHLMIQRIYREIMMMGLSSFIWTIVKAAGTVIPEGLYIGLQFADQTAFVMALYFCTQGIFIMVGSMRQAGAWERASKVSSEELQIDMERAQSTRKWHWVYMPFSVTRDQVEFRMLQSIFSSAYNISTRHTELNFGLFLQMTHETNLLNIIDFSNAKWALVIVITGIVAIKLSLFHTSCPDKSCAVEEEIWTFTICGMVNMLFALLVSYWGRQSEIKLFRVAGVDCVDDYPVFLMVEAKMQELLARNVVKSDFVKTAINELATEQESTKIEELQRRSRKRQMSMSVVANRRRSSLGTAGGTRSSKHRLSISQVVPTDNDAPGSSCASLDKSSPGNTPEKVNGEGSNRSVTGRSDCVHQFSVVSMHSNEGKSNDTSVTAGNEREAKRETPPRIISRKSTLGDGFTVENRPLPHLDDVFATNEEVGFDKVENIISPPAEGKVVGGERGDIEAGSGGGLVSQGDHEESPEARKSSMSDAVTHAARVAASLVEGLASHADAVGGALGMGLPSRSMLGPPLSGRGPGMNGRTDSYRGRRARRDELQQFKRNMQNNFGHENFTNVFVFGRPQVFYNCIDWVITCNSLYLAWWTTNFVIYANNADGEGLATALSLISLIPPMLTFPVISYAIKSSTILKALSSLNLDVVATVVEKTESNLTDVEGLREKLTRLLAEDHHGTDVTQTLKDGMMTIFEDFSENQFSLTYEEFLAMLTDFRIHYTPQKSRTIFRSLDINLDGNISIEVRVYMWTYVYIVVLLILLHITAVRWRVILYDYMCNRIVTQFLVAGI